jgi:hypothetical protein
LSQISLLLEANFGRGIAPYQRVGHDLEAISGVRCAPTTPEISNRVMKCACTSPGWAKSLELIVMWVNEWYMIASHTMGVPARSKLFARNLLVRGGGIFLASYLSCNPTQLKSRLSTALQSGTACRGYLGFKNATVHARVPREPITRISIKEACMRARVLKHVGATNLQATCTHSPVCRCTTCWMDLTRGTHMYTNLLTVHTKRSWHSRLLICRMPATDYSHMAFV